MLLSTITTAQFQTQFFRDWPYLPTWVSTSTYNAGNTVYYNGLFYNATQNGLLNVIPAGNPTQWQQVAGDPLAYVQPQDITNAFAEAQVVFNQELWGDDNGTFANLILAYLYCTAHYLVNDLRTASQGVNSTGNFPVASRSVGSVSETYQIPDRFKDSPQLAFFTTTGYGQKYLSMMLPNLVGNIGHVYGGTNP